MSYINLHYIDPSTSTTCPLRDAFDGIDKHCNNKSSHIVLVHCRKYFGKSSRCRSIMTMMSQSVNEENTSSNCRVEVGGGQEMTQQQQSTASEAAAGGGGGEEPQNHQRTQSEKQRQELEVKINELRAKCRLQAEQLMAWRKAYAIEVSRGVYWFRKTISSLLIRTEKVNHGGNDEGYY